MIIRQYSLLPDYFGHLFIYIIYFSLYSRVLLFESWHKEATVFGSLELDKEKMRSEGDLPCLGSLLVVSSVLWHQLLGVTKGIQIIEVFVTSLKRFFLGSSEKKTEVCLENTIKRRWWCFSDIQHNHISLRLLFRNCFLSTIATNIQIDNFSDLYLPLAFRPYFLSQGTTTLLPDCELHLSIHVRLHAQNDNILHYCLLFYCIISNRCHLWF